jgi:hypothetical protein
MRKRYKRLPISEDLIFFIVVCISFVSIFAIVSYGRSAHPMNRKDDTIMEAEQLRRWIENNPVPDDASVQVSINFALDGIIIQVPVESIKWDEKSNQLVIGGFTDVANVTIRK